MDKIQKFLMLRYLSNKGDLTLHAEQISPQTLAADYNFNLIDILHSYETSYLETEEDVVSKYSLTDPVEANFLVEVESS